MNRKSNIINTNRLNAEYSAGKSSTLKLKTFVLFILAYSLSFGLNAQTTIETKVQNLENGIAISGYDPVAYFTLNKALPGKNTITYIFNGAVYYFATGENRLLFIKAPEKFVPEYGGWCAYAMATKGEKVEIDPSTFKIVHGKLLLFYNKFFNNTLTSWNKEEASLLPKADANWKKLIKN